MTAPHLRVAIVGSGFAGICTAIRLKQEGIHDFVLLERADDLGGTWRDNTYPGCRCDVPSHLYSFSFEPKPDWSSTFSPQQEIWDYLRHCAERYAIMPHIRYGHDVREAAWDEPGRRWAIDTAKGSFTADVLVSGMGALSKPSYPSIPGLESFAGSAFHSAAWDHGHDLTGERVAVIGTGASAVQFVPEIQPRVGRLHVFQRTAPWIMPRRDRDLSDTERRVYSRLPAAQLAMRAGIYWAREAFVLGFMHPPLMKQNERLARSYLHAKVSDPELRAKLTPDYTIGCKRILLSRDYLPALTKPGVELVTERIREVRTGSIATEDGVEREVDTIIFGTGFKVTDAPAADHIRGRDGVLMADLWRGSPRAHAGTTVAGFPNLFLLVGPNTGLGHNSIVFMIESQVNYVIDCLRHMDRRGAEVFDVRPEAQAAFNRKVQKAMQGTVWTSGNCDSWYLDSAGRNTTLWPGFTWPFRRLTRRFDPAEYRLTMRDEAGVATAA